MYYPIISIIIVAENQDFFLEEALDSILMQSYPHWEAIVINNSSHTKISTIMKKYEALDTRIIHKYIPKITVSEARIYALNLAKGEWISFLNIEDFYMQDRFANLIASTYQYPNIEVFHTDYLIKNEVENTISHPAFSQSLTKAEYITPVSLMQFNTILSSTLFIQKKILQNLSYNSSKSEYALLLQLTMTAQTGFIDSLTCYHRVHELSHTTINPYSLQFDMGKECIIILQQYTLQKLFTFFTPNSIDDYKEKIDVILDTVFFQDSIVYGCGIHNLLIQRLIEWLANAVPQEIKANLIEYASANILPKLELLPYVIQHSCTALVQLKKGFILYQPEELSIILARSGGEILRNNPSTAMLYMNYYQKLFPEIYPSMLSYFNELEVQDTSILHRQQNIVPPQTADLSHSISIQ